ncbi:MAG: UDP-N-acetylmuramate dehydrogenase [Prevotellaceae bacterium]|jgi:UDP-N-acetylmuramate dehydrogenase|nr:UDP-N-acetylmuramate dehydrogenase [Prevotellaceae bacterium]
MNKWEENKSLKPFNTFGFEAKARYFATPDSTEGIEETLETCRKNSIPVFILGGGSNVVFSKDFDGLVLCPRTDRISISRKCMESRTLVVSAGVVWDDFVRYTVENNLMGVENLSGIPGTVGAAPVQNIGAYGMEAKDSIYALFGIMIDDGQPFFMENRDCKFTYRSSIFKNELKWKAIITRVAFKLAKGRRFKIEREDLQEELRKYGTINLSSIRQSILNLRAAKLPDPGELGNAGSFFKNPVVEQAEADRLLELFPSMPVYSASTFDDKVKLSAGWMIENCSLKGYRENNIGVYDRQALVLVNYGGGTANELILFSRMVQDRVFEKFGVKIEPEVDIV